MELLFLKHSIQYHQSLSSTCIIFFLLIIHPVHSNYCDHNLCSSNEYCCGENLCCNYTNWTYYFWVVLVIATIIISLFWASFHIYFGDIRNVGGRPFIVKLIEKFVEYLPPKYKSKSSHLMPSSPKVRHC